jgi:hypothetical protein
LPQVYLHLINVSLCLCTRSACFYINLAQKIQRGDGCFIGVPMDRKIHLACKMNERLNIPSAGNI